MKLFGKKETKERLTEILRGVDPPMLSGGVLSLLRLLRDADSDINDIAAQMQWNPGMVVGVLRTVNSAAFGLRHKVDCVQQAANVLGRSRLEQLVLGLAVKDELPRTSAPGFDARRFWHAAFFRAATARAIAAELHPADQARCFTGGLLQDMAVPLLAHARDDYGPVLGEWHGTPSASLHALEKSALGWSHDEVGGHLAEEWELPPSLASVIQSHHSDEATDAELPPALRLVALHRETEREYGLEVLVEEAGALYGLRHDRMAAIIERGDAQARELSDGL
jgi:HD-like signal output (HDOD) protein